MTMTSKHTPGPWKTLPYDGPEGDAVLVDGEGNAFAYISFVGNTWVDRNLCAENLSIIAAAPEMLNAHKVFMAGYGDSPSFPLDFHERMRVAYIAARDVVAKAEGKVQ